MRATYPLLLLLLTLLMSCSGGELVGIYVEISPDGSGTFTTRALAATTEGNEAEAQTKGVTWNTRATLISSQGSFDQIGEVSLGGDELTFLPQLDGSRPGLRVRLARGADAKWIQALVPAKATRRALARAYDPSGRTKEIGDTLRIEISAPGEIITSGVLPTGRGVSAEREGKKAVLLLPVRTAIEDGEAFSWDLSWLKKR
jgi:hypothetical protein